MCKNWHLLVLIRLFRWLPQQRFHDFADGGGRGCQPVIWPNFAENYMDMKNWTEVGRVPKLLLCRSATGLPRSCGSSAFMNSIYRNIYTHVCSKCVMCHNLLPTWKRSWNYLYLSTSAPFHYYYRCQFTGDVWHTINTGVCNTQEEDKFTSTHKRCYSLL